MSRSADNSNPSSSVPSVFDSSGSKATKPKMKITIEDDGSIMGEHSKLQSTRIGDLVRAHIPICYKDIRKVPKNFKDDVWNALMVIFYFYAFYLISCSTLIIYM